MTERSYKFPDLDKRSWGVGDWLDEPDKVVWVDEATDLDCMIVRNRGGALCGYVGIPTSHPWHGKEYGQCVESCEESYCCGHSPESRLDVHGCITFAGPCAKGKDESEHVICHTARPEVGEVWWFGFDTAHLNDYAPAYSARTRRFTEEVYKTVAYVKSEVARLAAQLAEVA